MNSILRKISLFTLCLFLFILIPSHAAISATPAFLTAPINGSTLSGASVTFAWSPGSGASQYFLYIGSTAGALDIYSQSQGANLSATVSNLPTDGRTLYVRLSSLVGNAWEFSDYTYKAATQPTSTAPVLAFMTAPVNGSILSGASVTFAWSPGSGVSQYTLSVGSTAGALDIYSQSQGANLSVMVNNMPTDGRTLYVRLSSLVGGVWKFNDYKYKAATPTQTTPASVVMTAPANGSTLSGASVAFAWSAGSGVSQYSLSVGSTAGASDIYSQLQGSNLSVTVNNLPTDGRTLYVRLSSLVVGVWKFNDYTYKAAGQKAPALMTTPINRSTLPATPRRQ